MRHGSLGERIGLRPGDIIESVNGVEVQDVIDFMYQSAAERVTLGVSSPSGHRRKLELTKCIDEGFGIRFEQDTFDGVKTCQNSCAFCFVSQLPPGLRPSLLIRDDDYRLSFLHGNFITMTNMTPGDFRRIARLRLSPLYISVHTMNPELRCRMLGNPRAAEIEDQLAWLAQHGIRFHCQVVVVPGFNDGIELERTLKKLSSLRPWAESVGVVPVGLTRYHRNGLRRLTPEEARDVVERVEGYQKQSRASGSTGWVYASDELYLMSGKEIPAYEDYDEFPQLENGIGMVASFLESVPRAISSLKSCESDPPKTTVVCGTLSYAVLKEALRPLDEAGGGFLSIRQVPNCLLGDTVTVSGLLSGRDIAETVMATPDSSLVAVPFQAAPYGRFIDDSDMNWLRQRLNRPVIAAGPNADDLVAALKTAVIR